MASAVSYSNTAVAQSQNTTAINPKGQLSGSDFMKLLLAELQQQDPTSPMDTDKMLQQTTQLSTLESQNATKTAMESMTTAFTKSAGYGLMNLIGHAVDVGDSSINVTKGQSTTFQAYFPNATDTASVVVKDSSGNTLKSIILKDGAQQGVYQYTWDGTTDAGTQAGTGSYKTYVQYKDSSGTLQTVENRYFPVSGIQPATSTSEAQVKVGSQYIPASRLATIY